MKREENMTFWKKNYLNFIFFNIKKIHKKFKQHSINIKNYTAHPHDLVHVPFEKIQQCVFELQCEN